jgi:hypothetical protein
LQLVFQLDRSQTINARLCAQGEHVDSQWVWQAAVAMLEAFRAASYGMQL